MARSRASTLGEWVSSDIGEATGLPARTVLALMDRGAIPAATSAGHGNARFVGWAGLNVASMIGAMASVGMDTGKAAEIAKFFYAQPFAQLTLLDRSDVPGSEAEARQAESGDTALIIADTHFVFAATIGVDTDLSPIDYTGQPSALGRIIRSGRDFFMVDFDSDTHLPDLKDDEGALRAWADAEKRPVARLEVNVDRAARLARFRAAAQTR